MLHKALGVISVAIALPLAGCASGPTAVAAPSGDRVSTAATGEEDYKLGVGDKVRVTVFHEETLSGEFAISASGTLAMPLIGSVPAKGKTSAEVAADVTTKLASGYVRDPKVGVEVIAYRPYYVLGEVKASGTYPFVNGLTAMNAIATAQGFTPRANQHYVFIRRDGEAEEKRYELTPNLRVLPGDTIRLGERYF